MIPITPSDQFAICYANQSCAIQPLTENSVQMTCQYIKKITQMALPLTIDVSSSTLEIICDEQSSLQQLACYSTTLDDAAIQPLEKLKKLELLFFSGIVTENITNILKTLPNLRLVILSSPNFGKDAYQQIKESIPNACLVIT